MKDEFEMIADDAQAAMMNREYERMGIVTPLSAEGGEKGDCKNGCAAKEQGFWTSEAYSLPLPVYMRDDCLRYLSLAESAGEIINSLDGKFRKAYKDILGYVYKKENENCLYIRALADIKEDVRAESTPAPLKNAMTSLLHIASVQSVLLDRILSYDKSWKSKEIRLNQLSAVGALNTLFSIAFG